MSVNILPERNSEGYAIIRTEAVHTSIDLRARIKGTHFATITASTTQDIDWAVPSESYQGVNKKTYFNGVEYYAKDAVLGDTIKFQVVDVDNILGYGAGFVVEEFADVYVMPDAHNRYELYKAKLVVGLYIRLKYTSTGGTNVTFACNMFRHLNEKENA